MISEIRAGVKRLFAMDAGRRRDAQRDADDELAAHLEERAQLLAARGMPIAEARAEAARRLGGSVSDARDELRRSAVRRDRRLSVVEYFADVVGDLRYALRGLRREPVFSAFAVVTLALGIGANAAMFGVVDRLLLRGPAYVVDPTRVVRLFWTMRQPAGNEMTSSTGFDKPVYPNLRAESRAFSELAVYAPAGSPLFGTGADSRPVPRVLATASFFDVLGVHPQIGRFFSAAEQEAKPPASVVVIGYDLWQRDFGGDRDVIGKRVTIGGATYNVVGVAPKGFTGVDLDRVDLWTPATVSVDPGARHWSLNHSSGPRIIGRLKPGVSIDQAGIDATEAHRRTYDGGEKSYADGRISAGPLSFGDDGQETSEANISRWLIGLSVIVLLVACANIANLLLARAVRRRREMAVRLSLGASRRRLMRLLLTETMLLAVIGGAVGLAVALATGGLVRRVLLPDMDWGGGIVDGRVLGFALAMTALVGILIGLGPGWRAGRADVVNALKAGAREGGGRRSLARNALTLAQAALAMVLLMGAGLFVASLQRVRRLDLGVDTRSVIVLSERWASPPQPVGSDSMKRIFEYRDQFAANVVARLRGSPGIEHAALSVGVPFRQAGSVPVRIPGLDSLPRLPGNPGNPDLSKVSTDYFATVGTRLIRGRLFTNADRAGSVPVAIVSKTMADVVWPGRSAIGQCLLIQGPDPNACTYVVGVVQDTRRFAVREEPSMHYYVPLGQGTSSLSGTQILVRPRGDAVAAIPSLRQLIRQLDPSIRYVDARTLQDLIEPQFRSWEMGAMMFSLFAGLALVVAAVGLFSVVAYFVEQRRHEIGVRIALGARASDVVALVMRGTVTVVAAGVAAGGAVSVMAGKLVQPLLFETNPNDPRMLGALAIVLLTVSVCASGIPALRARRVDAMTALRDE